jgi:hypothetical protein
MVFTETSRFFMRDDGIVIHEVVSPRKQTVAHVQANIRAFEQVAGGQPRLLLVDMKVNYSLEPKARAYYAGPEAARGLLATALITPSAATRILGNFFLALNHPPYPCRMFATVDEGLTWLHARGREIGL